MDHVGVYYIYISKSKFMCAQQCLSMQLEKLATGIQIPADTCKLMNINKLYKVQDTVCISNLN